MVLSKKTHDKGAADVYTVPRLKTSIAPVVSVALLPKGWAEENQVPAAKSSCEVLSAILSNPSISEEQRGRLQALLFRIIRLIRAFPN